MKLMDFALADEQTLINTINENLAKEQVCTMPLDKVIFAGCHIAFKTICLLKEKNKYDNGQTLALDIVDAMGFEDKVHHSYNNLTIAANSAAAAILQNDEDWVIKHLNELREYSASAYKSLYVQLVQTIETVLRYFILEPEKTIPTSQTREIIQKAFKTENDKKYGFGWKTLEEEYSEGQINSISQIFCNYGLLDANNTLDLHGYRRGCSNYYSKSALQLSRLYFSVYYSDKVLSKVINNRLEKLGKLQSLDLQMPLQFEEVDIRLNSLCEIHDEKYTKKDIAELIQSLRSVSQFVLNKCEKFRNVMVIIAKDYNLEAAKTRESDWYKINVQTWKQILPEILTTCYDIVVGTNKNREEKNYSYVYCFEFGEYGTVISDFIPEFGNLYKKYKKDALFRTLKEVS